ncbi:DNA-binding transcriptional LysR family regulator [Mycoplana sp. BE70]|uniref:LysR substrate-binding domain-containing protein n=1 Tax=Mycoplana sp. BE70 TaxID=2817775 RepID=UPI0028678892|nr:LysR substrate-binding domain-containing protein [Mycoplana sp. BE70]MDR6759380.1 DNA-binding transcriptional LysR family regulator [Mycoplana sp. BE70]
MPATDLNLRHLRAFMRVCEFGSLNRAAAELNVSQPSLSVALAGIEERFEAILLTRYAAGSQPTTAGEVLLVRLRRMENQLSSALGQALGSSSQRDPTIIAKSLARVTFRQIEALITLAGSGSITQAARSGGTSAAALHRSLHDLQANIGRAILVRSASGVAPNALGRRLATRWQIALTELEQAVDELREIEGRMEGRIKIASLPLARTLLLARAVNQLLMAHPSARVEVMDGSYELLSQQLRIGTSDILIGALRSGNDLGGLRTETLFEDPYAIVGRPGHPLLTSSSGATLDQLARQEWVAQRPGTPIRAAFDALFEGSGTPPSASIETSSLVLTRAIILESDRLSMLSRRQIAIEERENLLSCVPVTKEVQSRLGSRTIGITMRENWLPSRLQATFLECIRDAAANLASI